MSATKSELESPGGNRKLRPEIQRYVPGKTKISKQEQNQNDENSQKRLLELINQKQKFRNEKLSQQNNGERAKSRKNSENVSAKNANSVATNSHAKAMAETNNNEQQKSIERKEPNPKKPNQNKRKNTKKKDSRPQNTQQQDNSDARSDISRASTNISSRGGRNNQNRQNQKSSKFQEFRKISKQREEIQAREERPRDDRGSYSRGGPPRGGSHQPDREVRIQQETREARAKNDNPLRNNRNRHEPTNRRDTDTRTKSETSRGSNQESNKRNRQENNRSNNQKQQKPRSNAEDRRKVEKEKTPPPDERKEPSPEIKSPEKALVSTPQKTADWGDLMNEEDEGFSFEPPGVSRRDSWATLENSSSRDADTAPRPSGSARQRPQKIKEEDDSSSSKRANGISVIRINPSQMSRVRKESEKYNASDSDGYSTTGNPGSVYGNRARAPPNGARMVKSRPRGGGRSGYDPDYDRNINRYRGRNDDNFRDQDRVVEMVNNDTRRRTKESDMKYNLENAICNFKQAYESARFLKTSIPEKKRALDIFTQLVTFHPVFTFSEKVFDLVWKGIFYREVEIFRKKLENSNDQEETSRTTADFVECLLMGVDFYDDLVRSCEEKFQFSVKYHENHGIKVARAKQVKVCLYLCQQFFIHMGDLSRYIEQLDRSALPRLSRKMPNSREFYTTAKNLDPRHAKPHYQLGVLSTEQQRHFEAIIHYIRAASVDKGGGSGTAMSLNKEFEMARREAVSFLARKEHQKELAKTLDNREIWFIKRKLPNMAKEQLNKRFKLTFLAALGRIFTGIDVAMVKDFLEQAYSDLDSLISMTKNGERPYIPAGFLVELSIAAVFGIQQSIERKQNEKDALMMFFGLLALLCRRLKNKLKSLMKTCPDGDIYIIGDGMCRLLAFDEIQNRTTHVYPNPGRTINEIKQRVEQLSITTGPTVPICILHVGSEDSSTAHQTKPVEEIVTDFRELVSVVKSTFPNAAIYFSEIFPRWDQDSSRSEKLNNEIYRISPELGIKFLRNKENFNRKELFVFKEKELTVLSDKGKKLFSSELTKCIEKELSSHNDFGRALENDQVSALLPAMRILTEYLATHHQHSMFASQRIQNLESVGSCGAIFSELANLICHKELPVHVSSTTRSNHQDTVNCIETVDLQGFKPLKNSEIGKDWFGAKSNRLFENTVRMTVISKALDAHAKEENRAFRVHRGQFLPTETDKNSPNASDDRYLVKYVVPDTNCWIEKSDKLSKLFNLEDLHLEVLVSLCVKAELEGLTKSEKPKVAKQAEKSLDLIESERLRSLTSKGVILAAGKSYAEQHQNNIRNDDIIKNSVKLAKNSVLLTDDKNLMLKSRSEKVPVMMVHQFLDWSSNS